jgi:CRISPR/Cas system-associated protein Cas10 (large subunit of type III CRISPR-Cas system)
MISPFAHTIGLLRVCARVYFASETVQESESVAERIKVVGGEEASRECPNCHSKRIWKDVLRETRERIEAYLKVGYEWVGQDNKGQVYLRKRC